MRIQLNVSNSLEDNPGAGSPEGKGLREERGEGDPNIVPPLQRPKSKLFKRRKMKLKVLRVRAPVACEQQTHFRSSLLSLRKIATFRRERSDDRKCVCCSQARAPVACAQMPPSAPRPPSKRKGLGERASVHRLGLQENEMVQTKGLVRHVIP